MKNIKPLVANASKFEEIEWLRVVADSVPAASYLNSLLTERLIDWTEGQIRNDFPPDVLAEIDNQKAEVRKLQEEKRKLEEQLRDAGRQIDKLRYNASIEAAENQRLRVAQQEARRALGVL